MDEEPVPSLVFLAQGLIGLPQPPKGEHLADCSLGRDQQIEVARSFLILELGIAFADQIEAGNSLQCLDEADQGAFFSSKTRSDLPPRPPDQLSVPVGFARPRALFEEP